MSAANNPLLGMYPKSRSDENTASNNTRWERKLQTFYVRSKHTFVALQPKAHLQYILRYSLEARQGISNLSAHAQRKPTVPVDLATSKQWTKTDRDKNKHGRENKRGEQWLRYQISTTLDAERPNTSGRIVDVHTCQKDSLRTCTGDSQTLNMPPSKINTNVLYANQAHRNAPCGSVSSKAEQTLPRRRVTELRKSNRQGKAWTGRANIGA